MSKQPSKFQKMDQFKSLIPEVIHHSSRFCVWCKWVLEEQRDVRSHKCTNPKCQKNLPLIADLDYPINTWWMKCVKCFSFARSDFKFCELCGHDLAKTIRDARTKQARHLEQKEKLAIEENIKLEQRRIIRQKEEELKAERLKFEEEKHLWKAEQEVRLSEALLKEDELLREDQEMTNVDK